MKIIQNTGKISLIGHISMGKLFILTLLICLFLSPLFAVVTETASLKNFLLGSEPNCEYDRWISHIAERVVTAGYNTYAPYDRQLTGFGNYITPTADQLTAWGNVLDLFLAGELDAAQTAITSSGFPYQVVEFIDSESGRTYHMLRETLDMQFYDDNTTFDTYDDEEGAFAFGWGLYIYNPQGTRPVIVTTPHPCDDFPTPALSYEAFKVWDAKFLLIAGAGREVLWTNAAPYNNSKSLSDPTRVAAHPFNTAYKKFADVIRAQDSIRELSVQIHTYDWNYHAGYPNIQISAGYNKLCPNLPIRDLSSQKLDIVNQGSHLMIPANTIGLHRDVFLNDYYAVNYSVHDFTFSDGEQEYAVNDYIDLPAYSQNQQMLYTLSGWNDYDSYDPFFHIEMDELPNSYDLTENTYKWFYGWNENLQRWDFDNLFTNFNAYYMPWIDNLNSVLNPLFTMNDGMPPTAPMGLTVQNQSLNSITLRWTKTDSYDFSTYEILYGTEPIGIDNYQIFDRNSAGFLASADCESITVTGLANSNSYFFQIRAKDKNGMLSAASNEVTTVPAPANIYSFAAYGVDNAIRLSWGVSGQVNNSGFTVYRKSIDSDWATLDSYATNPALVNATANNFEWWDHDVTNGQTWTYMISSTNTLGNQFYYNYPATASPQPIHTIWIKNADATLVDSVFFAQNPYASDAQDTYYDVTKASPSSPAYVWNAFWQPYWGNNGTQLLREIKGGYDTNLDLKTWTMRVRSTQLNTPLFISASDCFDRAQKLYVYDSGNQTWHNLFESPYQFMVANTNVRTMTLYWGNLQPKVVHGNQNNRLYQGGTNVTFNWSYQNSFLIDHLDVYIKGETDSLLVAGGMTSSQTSFTYMLPQMTNIQNARLMIDVHAVDGLVSTYSSSYRFGIVPSMSQHYNESGWQTRANPWLDNTTPVTTIFGAGSSALSTTEEGDWGDTSDFSFGLPYWVNSPDVNFYSTMNAINPLETTLPLQPGWNPIPNPHLCEYPINNLRFTVNNSLFRYSEMIAQKLISPLVFVYRNGGYQAVDSILPYETFFVKYYGNPILETNISFYPYFTAPAITPPASYWQFKASFSGASTDTDSFVIGANPVSSDGYDFIMDLPSAPIKPFQSLRSYLLREAPEDIFFLDSRLYSEYRAPFANLIEEEKIWLFKLEIPVAEPVSFDLSAINLPDNYTIRFYLDEIGHTYTPNYSSVFAPQTPGTYNGMIKVTNYPVSNSDLVQSPLMALSIYPNPFNPSTTIAFSTPTNQDVKVDLYNIRGQKIRRLHNGNMKSGNHTLTWDGKDDGGRSVSSGIYFTKISAGKYSRSLKMVLMK